MLSQLEIALRYIANGIPVFPCSKDKIPLCKHGFKDATTTSLKIKLWWKKFPDALIGVPSDNLTVLDVDDYNICTTNRILVDYVWKELIDYGVIKSNTLKITSQRGGTHYYYKANPNDKRRCKSLPCIDLLGDGGYFVIADQKSYISEFSEPWDMISELGEFDIETYNMLCEKNEEITQTSKILKKKSDEKNNRTTTTSTINYTTDDVKFTQTPNMYFTSEDHEKENMDLLNDTVIHRGTVTEAMLKGMFYNQHNQIRLCEFLGLEVPEVGETITIQSMLPNHSDTKPSMGVRWSEDKNRILVRDFSNHYADKYFQNDYNIVRLYTTIIYKNQTPRFSAGEFNMWFLRMLYEAGLISVEMDTYQKEKELKEENRLVKKVAEGFRLLTGLKKLYRDFDGNIVFSDRFSAGWCGVPLSTANRSKRKLLNSGYMKSSGYLNLKEKDDGSSFYKTKLLEMIV